MNLNEIRVFLNDVFNKPKGEGKNRHIVFWYDGEGDFIDDIDTLDLEDVKLLKLTKNNYFHTKYYIEKEDLQSNILIYANMAKPLVQEDYLYDIYCYSQEFSTDRITVIMRELGITDEALKEVFKQYVVFFRNKDRLAAFKNLNVEDYTEEKVHLAILASLTKVKVLDIEEILKALIIEYLDYKNKLLDDISKFGDINVLYDLVQKYYGYRFEDFSIGKLMATMLITAMNDSIKFDLPKDYSKYISSKVTNCLVFVNHFMNHSKETVYYDKMANLIAHKIKVHELLEKHDVDAFINCDIFEQVDDIILSRLINLVNNDVEEFDKYINIISKRRTLHFYSKYRDYYKALVWAIKFLKEKKEVAYIKEDISYNMINAYVKEYYFFDKAYRKFYLYNDRCENKDILSSLREKIENTYTNWYLSELSIKWSNALNEENSSSWRINGVSHQDSFYNEFIKYKYNQKERVFVIISDALRYECAEELNTLLNNQSKNKWKGVGELKYMQGVLPSYTKLGMASLLPHKNIQIDSSYNVMVDGVNSSGTDNRDKILKNTSKDSLAITYSELINMKRADMKESFAGKDIVYIYHNTIDAIGDHASSERGVFNACEKAIEEILTAINMLIVNISASNVVITADHGFLYKRESLDESNKISGVKFEDGEDSRRFILTDKDEYIEGTLKFSMDYILGDNSHKYVITPRGTIRFKVQGAGSNYVHGGAMPQEVVIPVIQFKNDRSKSTKNEVRKTTVKLTSISRKVTNPIIHLEFFQEEKIQEKVLPIRVKCYFEDEFGNRISDESTIIADSKSDNPTDRSYREKFVLKSIKYDKNKKYFLVIQDEANSEGLYERIGYSIDIPIVDDFGF
ncbi:BREX-1 system phosphatase PglZ type A [Clostridium tarantellae]|uniref:BREX-1 system phosphatase PglZ type A n=1 Tax=Clostridium tarantellae TaxID=39493 RepID=A0A6I1MH69_9CLOT|nr:BREX-1 system phosphatase PglZ type A [Clostridium tarantellae]MPQ42510.1 BREX-1 system phosphatase PglZ type A [Clostridium tarantellae]